MSFKKAVETFKDFEPLRRALENNDVTTVLRVIRDVLRLKGIYLSHIDALYFAGDKRVVVYSGPIKVVLTISDRGIEAEIISEK